MLAAYVVFFFILIVLGAPIIMAMGFSSMLWMLSVADMPNVVLAQKIFTQTDSFALMAVPFFMLAGQIMERTGITECILGFANSVIGHIRGGLACTVQLAGMLMAGISGSANADAAALGSLTLYGLKDAGYDDGFAVSIVAAAGSLGPIIPPSILMIVYASISNMNVAKLFMGGVIPGIIIGCGYMVICIIYAKKHNIPVLKFLGFRNIWNNFKIAIWALLMPLIIIGGILFGIFTPTEAGVVAVLYGIAYGLVKRRLTLKTLFESLRDATINSAGPIGIIAMSGIFGYMLSREKLPQIVLEFCTTYITSPVMMLFLIIIISLIAGCFIDPSATMLMLVPILMPVALAMGIDQLHFSMIFCIALLTAGLTPPVGALLFIVAGIDNTPLKKVIRPIMPFIGIMLLVVVLMVFIPELGTWLPNLF